MKHETGKNQPQEEGMAVKTELTGEDLEHFRENGYLVLPQAFNAEEVARMQHEADRILELMIYSHYPRQSNIGHDVRNGPSRLRESPYEWEYQRAKDRGEFEDVFRAPVFSQFLTR